MKIECKLNTESPPSCLFQKFLNKQEREELDNEVEVLCDYTSSEVLEKCAYAQEIKKQKA